MEEIKQKLVDKSIEAFIMGLEIYNKPTIKRQLLVIFIHLYKKTSRCAVTTGILYDSFNACTILLTLSM